VNKKELCCRCNYEYDKEMMFYVEKAVSCEICDYHEGYVCKDCYDVKLDVVIKDRLDR
jgi:hypothetical protein